MRIDTFSMLLAVLLACATGAAIAQACQEAPGSGRLAAANVPTDADIVQREAEARAATAEARRAELLARLPPATARAPAGSAELRQFGAAGLVKAFDLARELAAELCTALPAGREVVLYDAAAAQGVLAARLVGDGIARLDADLVARNKELQEVIDAHAPPGARLAAAFTVLTVVPATVRAAADLGALFKTNVAAEGIAYGEGARSLFATALAQRCPDRVKGLGNGYLGELDKARYDGLLARVRRLGARRGEFANRVALLQKLAEAAKGEEKKELAAVTAAAGAVLKTVDGFVDSLRAGETGAASPLLNAARYLAYAARTEGMAVLDLDLRLEGMTIVKEGLFGGQRVRLSGVAFLWYRLHEPDGGIVLADALRRISRPVEIDLRGQQASGDFWTVGWAAEPSAR